MKPLIIIEGKNSFEFDDINGICQYLFGSQYFELNENEKFICRYELTFPISRFNNIPLVHTEMGELGENYLVKNDKIDVENSIIINDDKSCILSLCKIDRFVLLEEINSNYFTAGINKSKIKNNYIVVNAIAGKILKREYGGE